MKIELSEAVKCLLENDKIVILTHDHPDGDTLGCAFALQRALLKKGKKVKTVCNDIIPDKFSYMFDDISNDDFSDEKYIVSVDVANSQLLGKDVKEKYCGRINLAIDHHALTKIESEKLYVDDSAAAACEIIYDIVERMDVEIDEKMASCLYTGLCTDTGCFRYNNTTAKTHLMASKLIDLGADYFEINTVMFEIKTKTYLKLESLVMDTLEMHFDDRCVIVNISQDMYEKSGSNESETDPIAAKTRQIEGVLVGATIREKKDGTYKVSIRTNGELDASAICEALGGGGHSKAAGCQIEGTLEEAKEKLLGVIGSFLL